MRGGFKSTPRRESATRRLPIERPALLQPTRPERQVKSRRFPRAALTLFILAVAAYLVFFSTIFEIKSILIEGNNKVEKARILEVLPTELNFFRLRSDQIKQAILAVDPVIGSVAIFRGFPSSLKIIVAERQGIVVWKSGEITRLIDATGRATAEAPEELALKLAIHDLRGLPVAPSDQVITRGQLQFLQTVAKLLPEKINQRVDHFEVYDQTVDIDAITDQKLKIRFDTRRDPEVALKALRRVIESFGPQIKEYVDLRVEGWAYYK